jgi:hypothetical protein
MVGHVCFHDLFCECRFFTLKRLSEGFAALLPFFENCCQAGMSLAAVPLDRLSLPAHRAIDSYKNTVAPSVESVRRYTLRVEVEHWLSASQVRGERDHYLLMLNGHGSRE